MVKKVLFVSLVLFGIASFQGICISAQSDTTVDALIANYTNNSNLASTVAGTANQYAWDRKYDGASRLYQAIVDKDPNAPMAAKARLGLARIEVLNLLEQKEFEDAKQRIDSMMITFKDEPDTAIALFHIGQEQFWQRAFVEAEETFDKGVQMFPDNPAAKEMRLWSAKVDCCALIDGRRATDAEILAAIDKMINNFSDDPRLPGAVYWVTKEYEWAKGTSLNRAEWLNAPNSVYQQIMQKFSSSPFSQQAQLDQKRLTYRMKIFNLLKTGDQDQIDAAIESMVTDLKGRPEVAGELYWIACGYEEQPDKEIQAKKVYERIIQDYPESTEANSAALDLRRRVITDLINAGDANGAGILMDKFVADFKGHPYASSCLGRVAIGFYVKARKTSLNGDTEAGKVFYKKAIDTWDYLIGAFPDSEIAQNACYSSGVCYAQVLGDYQKGIDCFQKVVDKWPNYKYAQQAKLFITEYSQKIEKNKNVK